MSSILCLRKKAGLSQQYIADHLGISQGAVSQWEQGMTMPSADKLPLLAKLLGCTTDELLEPSKRRAGKGGKYMAKNLKYFRKLKTLMFDKEVDQKYIAEKAGKSIGYISNRFQGKQPFSMDDVYTIIEILGIPQEEALTYFPKGGIS